MTRTVVDRLAQRLETVLSRRSFVNRAALVGTAVVVGKGAELVLKPGTAYARVCGCAGQSCACGSACCSGYTAFCCTVNGGSNYCPPDTVMGGWWKADRSSFCGGGARYYMDCNATCTCGTGAFCSGDCDTTDCGCANGACDEWRTGCVRFRYGQCNQDVAPIGRIVCRMVSCLPPWELDPTCTRTSATDNNTAEHNAPCWEDVTPCPSPDTRCQVVGIARTPTGLGYALVTGFGRVFTYGDAVHLGDRAGDARGERVVGMAFAGPTGYWLATSAGNIWSFGTAPPFAGAAGRTADRAVVGIAATPSGRGCWLVTANGGVLTFGDAPFLGSLGGRALHRPVVGIAPTSTGRGYWLVAGDGGVSTFGDARFLGSLGGTRLNQPIVGMTSTSDAGYVLVAADGGVFTFGAAAFRGAALGDRKTRPAVGLVADPDGAGYWVAREDGEVAAFGAADHGSAVRAAS